MTWNMRTDRLCSHLTMQSQARRSGVRYAHEMCTILSNPGACHQTHVCSLLALQGGRSEQLPGNLPVPPKDRFERLLAEAEQCIRARSASPLLRPITPQFEVLADGSRAIQSGSADAAAAAGASSAADKSPLPRVSRLGDAGRQVGAQGLFPPHLELPAAATTATTVAGSRLCAGGLLGTSAAAACKSSAGGHSNRLEELQQRCLQVGTNEDLYEPTYSCLVSQLMATASVLLILPCI